MQRLPGNERPDPGQLLAALVVFRQSRRPNGQIGPREVVLDTGRGVAGVPTEHLNPGAEVYERRTRGTPMLPR